MLGDRDVFRKKVLKHVNYRQKTWIKKNFTLLNIGWINSPLTKKVGFAIIMGGGDAI